MCWYLKNTHTDRLPLHTFANLCLNPIYKMLSHYLSHNIKLLMLLKYIHKKCYCYLKIKMCKTLYKNYHWQKKIKTRNQFDNKQHFIRLIDIYLRLFSGYQVNTGLMTLSQYLHSNMWLIQLSLPPAGLVKVIGIPALRSWAYRIQAVILLTIIIITATTFTACSLSITVPCTTKCQQFVHQIYS